MKGWCCVCLGLGGGVVVGCDGGSVVVVVVNFLEVQGGVAIAGSDVCG